MWIFNEVHHSSSFRCNLFIQTLLTTNETQIQQLLLLVTNKEQENILQIEKHDKVIGCFSFNNYF